MKNQPIDVLQAIADGLAEELRTQYDDLCIAQGVAQGVLRIVLIRADKRHANIVVDKNGVTLIVDGDTGRSVMGPHAFENPSMFELLCKGVDRWLGCLPVIRG